MIIPKRKEAEKLEIGREGDREDTNKKWSVTTTDWVCRKHWLDPVAKKTFEPNEAETQWQLFHTKEKMNKTPWVERHTTKELPSHGRDSHESQPEETTETELKSVKNANPQWRLSRWRSQMKEPEKKGGGNTTRPELVPQGDPVVKETLDPNETETEAKPWLVPEGDHVAKESPQIRTSQKPLPKTKLFQTEGEKLIPRPAKTTRKDAKTDGGKPTEMSASEGTHAKLQAGQNQKQNGLERKSQN